MAKAVDPNTTLAAAVARGDAAAAGDVYVDRGKLLAPSTDVIEGREQIESYWRTGIDLGLSSIEREALSRDAAGDVAIEIGRYHLEIVGEGAERIVEHGKYLAVDQQQADGSTRRTFDVLSPDLPRRARTVRRARGEIEQPDSGKHPEHEGGSA